MSAPKPMSGYAYELEPDPRPRHHLPLVKSPWWQSSKDDNWEIITVSGRGRSSIIAQTAAMPEG